MDRSVKILWIIVSGLLLIAGIAIGTAYMIDSLRERALLRSERELENTVLLLTRHFDQQFEDFVDAQALVVARLQIADAISPADFKKQFSNDKVHQLLDAEVYGLSNSSAISIFESDGQMVATSQDGALPVANVSSREYFKAFKSNTTSATNLVEQVVSLVTGKPTTILARRLTNSNGVFIGVLTRRLDPYKFDRFFESVALGPSSTITMALRSGEFLARYPRADQMVGKNFGPAFRAAVANTDHGTSRLKSPVDGIDRLAASRKLRNFPIVIIATTTPAVALAEWREQTTLLVTVACLLAVVIVAIFLLIGWRLSKERKSSEQRLAIGKQRLDTALTNMSQGLVLFNADEKLVISNPRMREIYGLSEQQVEAGIPISQFIKSLLVNGNVFEFPVDEKTSLGSKSGTYLCRIADGRVISIRRSPTPDGGWVATHDDITESEHAAALLAEQLAELKEVRNRLESQRFELIATADALCIARDDAEAASRSKSDFLAMMSHEIRTPMAGMMGNDRVARRYLARHRAAGPRRGGPGIRPQPAHRRQQHPRLLEVGSGATDT
jgi:PAS domain-containing protein